MLLTFCKADTRIQRTACEVRGGGVAATLKQSRRHAELEVAEGKQEVISADP